ncbi:hypothetical protein IFR04_008970 [Cadophora malorum]|uniref:Uncharacterized protein n=1 Tax=Cadophora malorum TaxID=108018 RepID=A0A8H7TED9_9HELO|nr:hypothetical protein IFR04_008970 [Cadophora malorum]
MASQVTDIISTVLDFASFCLTVAGVIIAYHSWKALSSKTINATSILPLHLPRRPYHPYTTGCSHYLGYPYLRPLLQAAYRPHHRKLDAIADGGAEETELELMPLRNERKTIKDT